ncbi:Uncharacterised protein [Streptococcus pneumoniae]|nr:Uncharacterised protein [Streptococcus pneumoniae]
MTGVAIRPRWVSMLVRIMVMLGGLRKRKEVCYLVVQKKLNLKIEGE